MRELAVRLAVLRMLKSRIRELEQRYQAEFLTELDEGDSKAAILDDGTRLGKVAKSRGPRTPTVTNEAAFLEWVRASYPSEITESVRPAFREKVLASARRHGRGVDESSGEIIPGVELREGNPYISFRGERGFDEILAARIPELLHGALEIEAGES